MDNKSQLSILHEHEKQFKKIKCEDRHEQLSSHSVNSFE